MFLWGVRIYHAPVECLLTMHFWGLPRPSAGGTDTSRYTFNFLLLYTAMYPEVQDKLHDEVDRVLGRFPPFCLVIVFEVLFLE